LLYPICDIQFLFLFEIFVLKRIKIDILFNFYSGNLRHFKFFMLKFFVTIKYMIEEEHEYVRVCVALPSLEQVHKVHCSVVIHEHIMTFSCERTGQLEKYK